MNNANAYAGVFKPRRQFGRTGFTATALGIGDVADRTVPLDECVATVRRAVEAGLNVVDTAPAYEDGYSEQIVGLAVRDCRESVFLVDKVDHFDRPVAPQVEQSLRTLGLETVDLFLLHGVSTVEDWGRLSAPGGGLDQLKKCVAAGKCRFAGISSHHPDVLLAALKAGACDAVMFALGPFADMRYKLEVLPAAKAAGVATIGFKAFAAAMLLYDTSGYGRPLVDGQPAVLRGDLPKSKPHLTVEECVGYTMTWDADVTLLGLSFPEQQDAAFEAALRFKPLSPTRMAAIETHAAAAVAGKGTCWWNPAKR